MVKPTLRAVVFLLLAAPSCLAQQAAAPLLRVSGGGADLSLTAADLAAFPKAVVDIKEPHSGEQQHYEGVRLSDVLTKAGVPLGEKLRGAEMASYVVARASDGYKVVFSLAELDPAMNGNETIIAQTMNGKPLDAKQGPLKIVVPGEKRPARWIRMLQSLEVVRVE